MGGILSEIRVMTGALSVGLGRAAYEAALRYSKERVTFGKPIGEHQAVTFKLADMLTQLHAASLLVYHAAWCIDQGRPVTREAAMTKLFASEAANRICDEASRIFASYSFATEYPIERYFRDARFLLWGGGTSRSCGSSSGATSTARRVLYDHHRLIGRADTAMGEWFNRDAMSH